MAHDGLIRSLLAAVEAAPGDLDLRAHLAELLLHAGFGSEALAHAREVLTERPDDVQLLGIAMGAARSAGEADAAARYERLFNALGGQPVYDESIGSAADAVPHSTRAAATHHSMDERGDDGDAAELDEYDDFLRDVLAEDARTRIRLSDVAGLTDVKHRLEISFLGPLRNPELRKAFGTSLRGGLLLYGPPGCGKTYLARALAGELAATFIPVTLNDVLDMWLGNSEKRVHELFELARRRAPSVIFFDEVDAIGMKRSELRGSAGRGVISQLLVELDGMGSSNDDIFVLGATNQPWDVDSALRRPGRFDRTVLVLPPDAAARTAILSLHLRDKPVEDDLGVDDIAKRSDGFSGADLKLIVDSAAHLALEDSMSKGRVVPISHKHLKSAFKQSRSTTSSWFDVARNAAYFANQGGEYDDLIAYLERKR